MKALVYEEFTRDDDFKKILNDFELEKNNFKQICPIEMLDKLEQPITTQSSVKAAV